jgi:hypothetical protein
LFICFFGHKEQHFGIPHTCCNVFGNFRSQYIFYCTPD